MESDKNLGKNILYSGGTAASNVFLIVVGIAAARILHDRAFGEFNFALAIASIFETVIELGMSTFVVRSVSRNRQLAELYLPNVLGWKLILAIVSMGLMIIVVNLLPENHEAKIAAYIMGGAIVLRSYKATTHSFFQSHERFDLIMLTTYVERISVLVVTLGALFATRRLIPFVTSFALVRIPDLMFSLWLVHRRIAPVRMIIPSLRIVKEIQLGALPFGATAVVASCYAYIGTVILSSMMPMERVGWYSAGYKVYEGLTLFPYLICAVFLPKLSALYTTNGEKHSDISIQWLRYLLPVSIPIILTAGLLAPQLVLLFYGKDFLPAVGLLRILLVAAVLMFLNWSLTTILNSAGGEKLVLKNTFLGLLVMSAANLVLVRELGDRGAAYAVVVSEGFLLSAYLISVRRTLFHIPVLAMSWRPAVACATSGTLLFALHIRMPALVAVIFVATYAAVLLALKAFDTEDLKALKSLFSPSTTDPTGEAGE